VTSVEIPYSIAAVLPSLAVVDITNEVQREVAAAPMRDGIAFITSGAELSLVRVNEREAGFFADLEVLLGRLVPLDHAEREQLLCLLLGPRSEQVPFDNRRLCLGRWQRILVVGFDEACRYDWTTTLVG
jgi:thiamine phosphate synthase YjbQ (UPF0047 family)